MRTTVDIPDPLYRQLKGKAASEGRSVKELILRGVEQELRGPASPSRQSCSSDRAFETPGISQTRQCQDFRDHSFSLT